MPFQIYQRPSGSFGWDDLNDKVPVAGRAGRETFANPLAIYIGASGEDTPSMLSKAAANPAYNPPANPPARGVPHFHIGADGAIYQFVQIANAAWAVAKDSYNPTSTVALANAAANPNLYGIYITFESGNIAAPVYGSPPTLPNNGQPLYTDSQVEALGLLINFLAVAAPTAGEYNTYYSVNTRYSLGASQTLLDAALLYAEELEENPLIECNADLCIFDDSTPAPDGALIMYYDAVTRCPVGLGEAGGGEATGVTALNATNNNDPTSGVQTTYLTLSLPNLGDRNARYVALVEIHYFGNSIAGAGEYAAIGFDAEIEADAGGGFGYLTQGVPLAASAIWAGDAGNLRGDGTTPIKASLVRTFPVNVTAGNTGGIRVRVTPISNESVNNMVLRRSINVIAVYQ